MARLFAACVIVAAVFCAGAMIVQAVMASVQYAQLTKALGGR